MILINGRKLRDDILADIKKEVALLSFTPIFCDIFVGDDPVSAQYVRMKAKTAESVGIKFHNANFSQDISTADLVQEIKKLNTIKNMCGIIMQLPLPEHLDKRLVLDAIDPGLDVDCLGAVASEKFYQGETEVGFPTALACMAILDSLNLDDNPSTLLRTRKIVCLGQGELVGKPVAALLRFRGLEPIPVTRKTENKEEILKNADVIISGIGHGKHITRNMIKKGAVLMDAGTSEEVNGPSAEGASIQPGAKVNIVGDVDLESVKNIAGAVSPVPGGVGPVTVAMLLKNVLTVAKKMKT
ncbi:hypothetical protein A3I95_00845 [Candidatus Nomurabacteria bacterium RIFCSPLOWO2_02_FULL_44_12]|nr:MAG: hypothetical protein A3I95_00845 [Candidatus Nomurabacteria bacterium RIFCSPLOWO2_02_FULL_44_12]